MIEYKMISEKEEVVSRVLGDNYVSAVNLRWD